MIMFKKPPYLHNLIVKVNYIFSNVLDHNPDVLSFPLILVLSLEKGK